MPTPKQTSPQILLQFQEQEPWEQGFHEFLRTKVVPALEQQETNKSPQKSLPSWAWQTWLVVVAALFLFAFISRTGTSIAIAMVAVFVGIFLFAKPSLKSKLLPEVLPFFGEFTYHPVAPKKHWYERHPLVVAGLSANHEFRTDDYIEGIYKGFTIRIEDITIHIDQGEKLPKKVLHKVLVTKQLKRPVTGHTILRADLQGIARMVKDWGANYTDVLRDKKRVHLESVDFEKQFDVYSTDQVEARALLTPDIMARLEDVEKEFNASIEASFREDQFLLLIDTKRNFFEIPSTSYTERTIQELRNMLREFHSILSLIEHINIKK